MLFASWALIFDPKGDRAGLVGAIPLGLLFAGVCGWVAVFGRVGPKASMDLEAPAPRVPLIARIWAGLICLTSPMMLWKPVQQHAFPQGWYAWFNTVLTMFLAVYVLVVLARLCISGYWPAPALRFARRANMNLREQLAETRREREHRERNSRKF